MAAAMGEFKALRHLVDTYIANIDLEDQHGARRPDASDDYGVETPLYWLCSFNPDDAGVIPRKLSLHSVNIFLELGADPLEGFPSQPGVITFPSQTPVVMAAVSLFPRILETLLAYVDSKADDPPRLFTAAEILQIAIGKSITVADSTSLQSRLSRCGAEYKYAMFETLGILHSRDLASKSWLNEGRESRTRANNTILARMTKMAVENGSCMTLLQVSASRPAQSRTGFFIAEYLVKTVKNQNFQLADLLLAHGADINFTYCPKPNGSWITILAELVINPTEQNLESLQYLLGSRGRTVVNQNRVLDAELALELVLQRFWFWFRFSALSSP
ncbi:hypothetical protein C8J57DRAFT_1232239 [Mycena rebaudengoi]|nr:hypothetical protein C8J57DRAFT_1232239 [Mycena rebaudengoi]